MIYVFEQGNVIYDETTLTDEQKAEAIVVMKSLPEPDLIEGKISILRVDKVNRTVFYEYVEIPVEPIEEIVPYEPQPQPTLEQITEENLLETKYQTLLLEMML